MVHRYVQDNDHRAYKLYRLAIWSKDVNVVIRFTYYYY